MAQKRALKKVALDHMAGIAAAANEARQEARRLIAFAEEQEAKIKEAMGDAEEATIFGVPFFTYTLKDSYSFAKFRDTYPHVYRNYLTVQEQEVLDKDKLLREQGDLLADFQTREFRRVDRKPGT